MQTTRKTNRQKSTKTKRQADGQTAKKKGKD